ncbi:cyclase family protein [Georgenia ruanii]|uniref:Cyclase family protein n=1 Tax=Georgenia ruanii TaxID=348442 RepID=A0A7J9UXH0_9MICO|nr:cyclase family protein [Georgenia ruanii]MPV89328.1 cyclase family protein [Georgenia ruanii]
MTQVTPRFVDLSVPFENDVAADPPFQRLDIQYARHEETANDIAGLFPGLAAEDLLEGQGWAVERVTMSTHNGTHVDAPWHYHPTMDGGARAWTIDEVPLDWFFRPGVKLDFRAYDDGYVVQPADIDAALEDIGYELQPYDIVLMNTSAGAAYGSDDYVDRGCGFGREATLHLASRGIRVVGTDGWSWDAPFRATAQRYAETGDVSLIWEGHKAGAEVGYCQVEKLHNLDTLPATGFTVACFPAKVRGASAGWTRAVAILGGEA